MARYTVSEYHPIKCAYRIVKDPLYSAVCEYRRQEGILPGTAFNNLVRSRLKNRGEEYEISDRASLYLPNMIVKLDRKQVTLYLSPAESEKFNEICQKADLSKNRLVIGLLVDSLQKEKLI